MTDDVLRRPEGFNGLVLNQPEHAMNVIAESALRILLPRRNLHDPMNRHATRRLIHQSIAQIRASSRARVTPTPQ